MIPFEHHGLQNIRRISGDAMDACDTPSLLVIQSADTNDGELGLESIPSPIANVTSYPLPIEFKIGKDFINVDAYYDEAVVPSHQKQRICINLRTNSHNFAQNLPLSQLANFHC